MSKKTIILIAFVILIFAILITPTYDAFAQSGLVPCGIEGEPSCSICHLQTLAQNIIYWLVSFSVMVATLMFVYAGFTYITAGSDMTKISNAHNVFWRVFIGLIFVLSAWLVVDTIMKAFINEQKFGPWNEIECASVNIGTGPGSGESDDVGTGPGSGESDVVVVTPPASVTDIQTVIEGQLLSCPNTGCTITVNGTPFGNMIIFKGSSGDSDKLIMNLYTGLSADESSNMIEAMENACINWGGNFVPTGGNRFEC